MSSMRPSRSNDRRRPLAVLACIALAASVVAVVGAAKPASSALPAPGAGKPLYTTRSDTGAYATIDTTTGAGAQLATDKVLGGRGAALDPDGTLWGLVASQFAKVDTVTGVPTPVGNEWEVLGLVGVSIEVAGDGTLYTMDDLGRLRRHDKTTGAETFGVETSEITSDLAFDCSGTLWASFKTALSKIDTATGAVALQGNVTGMHEYDGISGLAFDDDGRMLAIGSKTAGLYQIDRTTLTATMIGATGLERLRGADINAGCGPADDVGKVHGSGASSPTNHFSFEAKYKAGDPGPKGHVNYEDKEGKLHLKKVTVTGLAITGTHAVIVGTGTVDHSPVTFRIDVEDLAKHGRDVDTFRIQWTGGYSSGGVLHKGDIKLHD